MSVESSVRAIPQPNIVAANKEAAGVVAPTARGTAEIDSHPARASVGARRAAIYVRVSRLPEDEVDTKISPDMQVEACRRLLDGYEVEIFSDLNMSGKNTDRPKYQEMLRRVDAGEVETVVAYELSRIS